MVTSPHSDQPHPKPDKPKRSLEGSASAWAHDPTRPPQAFAIATREIRPYVCPPTAEPELSVVCGHADRRRKPRDALRADWEVAVMQSEDVGRLAAGLAAVAIAALSPDPITAAALSAAIPVLRARWEKNAATRDLQRQVTDAIAAWAGSERLGDDLAAGLTIATATLHGHPLSATDLKDLDYDPGRLSREIIRRAGRTNPDWAQTEHELEDAAHIVARRAIHTTMAGLMQERHAIETTVLAAIRKESSSINDHLRQLANTLGTVSDDIQTLTSELTATASVGDLMIYLQQRIEDWDRSSWLVDRRPSQLERRLQVTTREEWRRELSVEQAVRDYPHLIILGGPGSGKSWLARRIARGAAQTALEELQRGADIPQVRIPILTTWETWTGQTGDVRTTLVQASFDTRLGIGDLGGAAIVDRTKRLIREATSVLVVIDSLDEANDKSNIANRILGIRSISNWRTVVTSRPGAWDAKSTTYYCEEDVAELQPLTWEADVQPFVHTWFATDPTRASALIKRLDGDSRLRETATQPLILTFYCLLAQSAALGDPLPYTRHVLYERVLDQLLAGDWTSDEPPAYLKAAKQLLTRWAWRAVRNATTGIGLGAWSDTIAPSEPPPPDLKRAIDHVAPRVGLTTRRFRHRTLLEHLVTKHIIGLAPREAAKVLLPHLWFDPDWEVVTCTAIAAHPRRDKLLDLLVQQALSRTKGDASDAADDELDDRLLEVAAETTPEDWSREHQTLFHRVRAANASVKPKQVARSRAWRDSNAASVNAILASLLSTDPRRAPSLVESLIALDHSEETRGRALEALIDRVPIEPWDAPELVRALLILGSTSEDHRRILDTIPVRKSWKADEEDLGPTLLVLNPTDETQRHARKGILDAVHTHTDKRPVEHLAEILSGLDPADEDWRRAFSEISEALHEAPAGLDQVVEAILALDPEDEDWSRVVAAILDGLHGDLSKAERLVEMLLALDPTDEEWWSAVDARIDPSSSLHLEHLIETADEDRRPAIGAILDVLHMDPSRVERLVEVLLALDPSREDRQRALYAVFNALATARSWQVEYLIEGLLSLVSTDRRVAWPNHQPPEGLVSFVDLFEALQTQVTTDNRKRARRMALSMFATADSDQVTLLVRVLRMTSTLPEWLHWLHTGADRHG